MQVTDVRVRKIAKEGRMKAVVSITLDEEFVVHDIKVIEGDKGLFIAMPSKRTADGEYKDIAHPGRGIGRDSIGIDIRIPQMPWQQAMAFFCGADPCRGSNTLRRRL